MRFFATTVAALFVTSAVASPMPRSRFLEQCFTTL